MTRGNNNKNINESNTRERERERERERVSEFQVIIKFGTRSKFILLPDEIISHHNHEAVYYICNICDIYLYIAFNFNISVPLR